MEMSKKQKRIALVCLVALFAISHAALAAVTLRLGTSQPPEGGFYGDTWAQFARFVEEETKGEVQVKVYYSGALTSNERELAAMVQSGAIDLAGVAHTYILGWAPSMKIFDLPFLFTDHAHVRRVFDSPVGEFLRNETLDDGVVTLALMSAGFRSIFNNVRPIYTVEDVRGMKIRSMESPVYLAFFRALNMLPTPMPSSELYTSLQLGVVDAGENDPASVISWGWVDVIKYYSLTNHTYCPQVFLMNKARLDSFSPEVKEGILRAARRAAEYQLDYVEKAWDDSLKQISDKGVKINTLDDIKPFQAAVEDIYAEYDPVIGNNLIAKVQELAQ